MLGLVKSQPDLTLAELRGAYTFGQGRFDELGAGAPVGGPAGSAAEKKSLHAVERDTETNRIRRAEFHQRILAIDPKRLVFLDESGISTAMTRRLRAASAGRASMKGRRKETGRSSPSWAR